MEQLEFGFFGGEPLLEWELLQFATREIESRASHHGTRLIKTLTTNGLLLEEEKIAWLHAHGFYLVISIDGDAPIHDRHRHFPNQHGSFVMVERAIRAVQRIYQPAEYATISVVTPQTIAYLLSSVVYLHEVLGVEQIHLSPDYYTSWDNMVAEVHTAFDAVGEYMIAQYQSDHPVSIEPIESKIHSGVEQGCGACLFGEQKLAIAPSGRLYPCEKLIGEDSGELMIGSVYEGIDPHKRHALITQRGNTNEACQSCPLRPRCTNSCGCTNYTLTGSIHTTDGVVCFFQKCFIEVADRVASTLLAQKNPAFLAKFYGE